MLRTLIHQELLTHLISARFFACVIITLLLVFANTLVLIGAHEDRSADHSEKEAINRQNIAATPTYSLLRLKVQRPPNPLSLFSAGLETRFGSEVDIAFDTVPTLSSPRSPLGLKNPYLNLFSQIDLNLIFQVVLSLLALLFAYDAIAGDREAGTLRLVLSHPVGRGSVLLAKFLAAMACLLLPVLISLLLVLTLCSLKGSMQLGGEDFLRIAGICLTTIVYLSVFYLIGLLISTTTRRAATSLILCLFLWVVLVLVYPNWSRFTLTSSDQSRAEKISVNRQIAQIQEETDREERRFLNRSPLQGEPPVFRHLFGVVRWQYGDFPRIEGELKNAAQPFLVQHLRHFYEFAATLRIHNAEKIGFARDQLVAQTALRQAKWDEQLMKLSPASLYTFATAAWAGTDLAAMDDYIRAARAYRHTVIDYFHDKAAFQSLQWFATNQGEIDLSGLPRFRFERAAISQSAQRALPELFLLFLTGLLLFMGAFLIFIKIEV